MLDIITVNFPIDNDKIINKDFEDKRTILDSDITIFSPSRIFNSWQLIYDGLLKNQRYVNDSKAYQIFTIMEEISREVLTLLHNGKTIVCLLEPVEKIFLRADSSRNYIELNNYHFLPEDLGLVGEIKSGESNNPKAIRHNTNSSFFKNFYGAYKSELGYLAYFNFPVKHERGAFLLNKSNSAVGYVTNASQGRVIFIPSIDYRKDVNKFISVVQSSINDLTNNIIYTKEPAWLNSYELPTENEIKDELDKLIQKQHSIVEKIGTTREKLEGINQYKKLLYEKGPLLEDIVLKSFRLFGFTAENRKLEDMEHDLIFSSKEGKGIAEIEGKDKEPIRIDKFDQLNRTVDEDFIHTDEYPQGILIGNPYRLIDPNLRDSPFTEKVLTIANKKSFGLLTTQQIFKAVEYILANPNNEEFKKECRFRILETEGEEIILVE